MGVRVISDKLVFISGDNNPACEEYSNNGWSGGCMTMDGQYFYKD